MLNEFREAAVGGLILEDVCALFDEDVAFADVIFSSGFSESARVPVRVTAKTSPQFHLIEASLEVWRGLNHFSFQISGFKKFTVQVRIIYFLQLTAQRPQLNARHVHLQEILSSHDFGKDELVLLWKGSGECQLGDFTLLYCCESEPIDPRFRPPLDISIDHLCSESSPGWRSIMVALKSYVGSPLSARESKHAKQELGFSTTCLTVNLNDHLFRTRVVVFDDYLLLLTLERLSEENDRTSFSITADAPRGFCFWELPKDDPISSMSPREAPFVLIQANSVGRQFFGVSDPIGLSAASLMPFERENPSLISNFFKALTEQKRIVLQHNVPNEGASSLGALADSIYDVSIRPISERALVCCWRDLSHHFRARALCLRMRGLLNCTPLMSLLASKSFNIFYMNEFGKRMLSPNNEDIRIQSLSYDDLFPDSTPAFLLPCGASTHKTTLFRMDGRRIPVTVTAVKTPSSECDEKGGNSEMYEILSRHVFNLIDTSRALAAFVQDDRAVESTPSEESDLEARIAMKNDFLTTVTHEIRTPLNGIVGSAELLQNAVCDAWQLNLVNSISSCSKTLLQIINDILDFAKMDSSKLELDDLPFLVADSVDSAVGVVASLIARKRQTLTYSICARTPKQIIGDVVRTKQIVLNLLNNAAKFTPEGGKIEIGLCVCEFPTLDPDATCARNSCFDECRVGKLQGGGYRRIFGAEMSSKSHRFRLFVSDTGPGMSQRHLMEIFSPFAQVRSVGSSRGLGLHTQESGTGLGLCIVRKLLELMGGGCAVRSIEGEGTCVSVFFPCSLPPETAPPEQAISRLRVAIDSPGASRQALCSLLEHIGIRPSLLSVGARLLSLEHDLCILDADSETDLQRKLDKICRELDSGSLQSDQVTNRVVLILPPWTSPDLQKAASESCGALCLFSPVTAAALRDVARSAALGPNLRDTKSTGKGEFKVLVVEDTPVNMFVLIQQLHRVGVSKSEITQAENGQQALDAAKEKSFNVILMDIHMPTMSGWEAARTLREHPGEYKKFGMIVALTAASTLREKEESMKYMDLFLSKPLQLQKLVDTLNQVCSRLNIQRHFMVPTEASTRGLKRSRGGSQVDVTKLSQSTRGGTDYRLLSDPDRVGENRGHRRFRLSEQGMITLFGIALFVLLWIYKNTC